MFSTFFGFMPGHPRRLEKTAQGILNQTLERGLQNGSRVQLYALPSTSKRKLREQNKKLFRDLGVMLEGVTGQSIMKNGCLRQEWSVVLNEVTGQLISKKIGHLCYRNLSPGKRYPEFTTSSRYHKATRKGLLNTTNISPAYDTADDDDEDEDYVEHDLMQRYAARVERKPGKGKGKGVIMGGKQAMSRLTYSKDRNLQARMM